MIISSSLRALFPLRKYTVHGKSMEPTITEGATVLVNRLAYLFTKPAKDDIVAFHSPHSEKVLLKRVMLSRGETVHIEGDNKLQSTDSREFGPIQRSAIIGKVVAILRE